MKKCWEVKKLIDLCDVFTDGDWIESKDQSSGGIRLIQTGNVGNGLFKDRGEKARYISEDTFRRLRCTEIFEGDCLISRLPDPVGRACILPNTGESMITAVDCTIVRFKKCILPKYFNYYSQSFHYLNDVDHETTGTTRKRISRGKLGEVNIPVPPLLEQRRIVSILDKAYGLIVKAKENNERNLQYSRDLFESYLTSGFNQSSNGWVQKRLEDVCQEITVGHVGSMANQYRDSGVPFLRSQNIRPFHISLENLVFIDKTFHKSLEKSQLRPGDVAVVRTGYPGTAAVIPESLPICNCSDLVIVRPGPAADPNYLALFFNSNLGKNLVAGRLVGAAQKHFNITVAKQVSIPLPAISEQRKFAEKYLALRKETQGLEFIYQTKLTDLDELKKSILYKAFNGELSGAN